MNGVSAAGAVNARGAAAQAQLLDPTTGKPLLPPPSLGDSQLDAMALLFLMQTKMRQQNMVVGKAELKLKHDDIKIARQKEDEALKQAAENSQKKSFWDSLGSVLGTVAKVAAVVASVALAIVSCGAGTAVAVLAIAGAVMSTAGFVQGEFHVLEKLGVDPDTAKWIGLGLSIGGAACSLGSGFVSSGAAAADAAQAGSNSADAAASASAGTGAAGKTVADTVGAGAQASRGAEFFKVAARAATATAGAAAVAGGACTIVSSDARADEEHALADAMKQQFFAEWLKRRIEALLDSMKDSDESDARVLDGIRGVMTTKGDTLVASVRA